MEIKKKYEGLIVKGCTPTSGEDQKQFMGRCISDFMDAGKDQDQATAICFSTWTGKIDKANSRTVNMTPEPDENESDFMDRCTAYHSGQGNDSLAETICSRAWDNKTDSGGLGVDIQSESSLSPGFLQVKRP